MIHGVDHIGIAVKSIDEAKKFWVDILGLKLTHIEEMPEQKVRVAMLKAGEMTIELLEPTSRTALSSVSSKSAARACIILPSGPAISPGNWKS